MKKRVHNGAAYHVQSARVMCEDYISKGCLTNSIAQPRRHLIQQQLASSPFNYGLQLKIHRSLAWCAKSEDPSGSDD